MIFSKIVDKKTKRLECISCGEISLEGYSEIERELGYDGNWYVKGFAPVPPAPTIEEQKEKRAQAYLLEVDPITAHIQRLRDEAVPNAEKIAALIAERTEKVEEIKARFPYPEDRQLPGNSGELEQIIASGD